MSHTLAAEDVKSFVQASTCTCYGGRWEFGTGLIAAEDVSVAAKVVSVAAEDVTVAAGDVTFAAEDVTVAAGDMTVAAEGITEPCLQARLPIIHSHMTAPM